MGVAAAASLDNTYLPPSNARTAGGNGNFLAGPNGGSNGGQFGRVSPGPQPQYGAPAGPSPVYGAPNGNYNGNGRGNGHAGGPSGSGGPSPVYGAPNGHQNGNGNGYRSAEARANILRYSNENNGDGNYHFEYETENKISQQEVGQVKDVAPEGGVTVVQGTYSYVGDDGQTYTVNYVADENGFQPTGNHIHSEIQEAAAEAARSAAAEVGYPASQNGYSGQNGYNGQNGNNGQNGYRY